MKNKFCCINCHREILTTNFARHKTSKDCKQHGIPATTVCRHCAKIYNSIAATASHETHCSKNLHKKSQAIRSKDAPVSIQISNEIADPTYNKTKLSCISCHKEIIVENQTRHFSSSACNIFSKLSKDCKFCKKSADSIKSNARHQACCKLNPDREVKIAWNKGKTKENDTRIAKYGSSNTNSAKLGNRGPCTRVWTDEDRENHSITMSKVARENPDVYSGRYNRYAVKRIVCLNGFTVLGSWEETFVNYCYTNGIEIEQPRVPFSYEFEDKVRSYYPDFYLPEHDLIIEVKGLELPKDVVKWDTLVNVHGRNLAIVRESEIKEIRNGVFNFTEFVTKLYARCLMATYIKY